MAQASDENNEVQQLLDAGQAKLEAAADVLETAKALAICELALADFKQARELAGDDLDLRRTATLGIAAAYSQRGHQHRYADNYSEALADLSQGLRLNPAHAEDYYYRARSYLAKGDATLARTDFNEYLKRGESDYLRELAKAELARLVPSRDNANAYLAHWRNEGVRLNSDASNATQPRGEAQPDWHKSVALYNRAIEAFNRALEASPKDMFTKVSLVAARLAQADSYRQINEYDLALENYELAHQVLPKPHHIFLKAETLLQAGHLGLARQNFEGYLEISDDPNLKAQAQDYLNTKLAKI